MTETTGTGASSSVEIRFTELGPWKSFVGGCRDGTPLHCAEWLQVLQHAYGLRLRIPALLEDGQVVAGLPFFETGTPFGKRRAVAAPFCDWLCPLAVSANRLQRFQHRLPGLLRAEYGTAVLHTSHPIGGFPMLNHRVHHSLDVDRSYAEISTDFSRGLKDNLRQAHRAGFDYRRSSNRQAFEQFCRLNLLSRRARGIPAQPRSFFTMVFDTIIRNNLGFIGIVELEGNVAASALFLEFNGMTLSKYQASNPTFQRFRPNDFLLSNAIRQAAESEMIHFDFGSSETTNQGLRHFKNKWGSREIPVFTEYVVGKPELDRRSRPVAALRHMIQSAIRRMPVFCCMLCGDLFYRYSKGNSW